MRNKELKREKISKKDWWEDLIYSQKQSIERGLNEIKEGKTVPHKDIKEKYGL